MYQRLCCGTHTSVAVLQVDQPHPVLRGHRHLGGAGRVWADPDAGGPAQALLLAVHVDVTGQWRKF